MKRPMECDEWALFGDSPEAEVKEATPGVGGVACSEHPYFKKRIFADEPLKDGRSPRSEKPKILNQSWIWKDRKGS